MYVQHKPYAGKQEVLGKTNHLFSLTTFEYLVQQVEIKLLVCMSNETLKIIQFERLRCWSTDGSDL
jgi:hypothetical protein